MKKNYIKIILTICILLITSGCGKKEVLTTNIFSGILKDNGFQILDISEQYSNVGIEKAYIGKNEDKYQIEYYILEDEENAKKIFEKNLDNITSNLNYTPTKKQGDNYQKYIFATTELYIVASKVENTFIYIIAPIEYQSEIDKILKIMDY